MEMNTLITNMGIGTLSLGYAYEKVDEAIKEQLADGITFFLDASAGS